MTACPGQGCEGWLAGRKRRGTGECIVGPSKNGDGFNGALEAPLPPPPIEAIVSMVDPSPPYCATDTVYLPPNVGPRAWDASAWDGDPMASCCRYMEAPYRAVKRAKYCTGWALR